MICHSDRGSQYTSLELGRTLAETGLVSSMGSRGCAYDNAACESVMATIKTEYVHRRSFRSRDQARAGLFVWIEGWYNPRCRHSSLGYRSPIAFERAHAPAGTLPRRGRHPPRRTPTDARPCRPPSWDRPPA